MKYTKHNVWKKKETLSSEQIRKHSRISLFLFKYILIISIAVLVAGLGLSVGFVRGVLKTTPQISKESVHSKGYITTIYDNKGKKIKTLSNHDSNRIYVPLSEIPECLQHAFISIEDERFYTHNGIDLYGIVRAAFLGMKNNNLNQGGSTLTQQLIKNNVLGIQPEKTTVEKIERKIKEQSMALELEDIASKKYILEEYLNTINLGEGTLGVQTASQKYFNKSVSDLTLSECAVLASIPKNPTRYNPITHPDNNAARRLQVLKNMLEQHYITKSEYQKAVSDDVYARIQKNADKPSNENNPNSYFEDALILQIVHDLKSQLGYDATKAYNAIYSGGLKIYSTQDSEIQKIADHVTSDPKNYPSRTKVSLTYTLTVKNTNGNDVTYTENNVLSYMKRHHLGNSLIFSSAKKAKSVAEKFRDHIRSSGSTVVGEFLSTTIQPQVSMTIMNQSTGNVEALVGGRGTRTSGLSINRATSTQRQPGSVFNVLSAFLPALDNGKTLATVYNDAPYKYLDTNRIVKNNNERYHGYSTIREGITNSINVVSAKAIADITPKKSYQYLLNLGFTSLVENQITDNGTTFTDVLQSLALGNLTYGVSNLELTNAYASIANGGEYHKSSLYTKVVDQNGNVLLSRSSAGKQVMKPSTAFLLTDAMQEGIKEETKAKLSSKMAVAGKAGTTQNQYDHWFSGYTPYHTASVWMGYDKDNRFDSKNLEQNIWSKVMNQIIKEKKETNVNFNRPSGIVKAKICKKSGKLAIPGVCDHDQRGDMTTEEYFAKGTIPSQTCDIHIAINICKDSGLPASGNCPKSKIEKKVYLIRQNHNKGRTDDTPYLLPSNFANRICNKH